MTDKADDIQLAAGGPSPLTRLGLVLHGLLKRLTAERHQRLADKDLENLPSSVKRDMGWPDGHLFRRKPN